MAEIRQRNNDEIDRDILRVTSKIYYFFWVNNTEHINQARKLIGYSYGKKNNFSKKQNYNNLGVKIIIHRSLKTSTNKLCKYKLHNRTKTEKSNSR